MSGNRRRTETTTDVAKSEDRFSERLGSFGRRGFFQRILDSLYGYDYFISYRWSDGRIYALALAEELQMQGFDCFLDSEDYATGDNWKIIGERALKKTTRLDRSRNLVCAEQLSQRHRKHGPNIDESVASSRSCAE